MQKISLPSQAKTKTIQNAFDEFIRYCKIKNLSPHAIAFYERHFSNFLEFYKGGLQDIDRKPSEITSYICMRKKL